MHSETMKQTFCLGIRPICERLFIFPIPPRRAEDKKDLPDSAIGFIFGDALNEGVRKRSGIRSRTSREGQRAMTCNMICFVEYRLGAVGRVGRVGQIGWVGLVLGVVLFSFSDRIAADLPAASETIGRPVHVVSIGFRDRPLEEICAVVDREAAKGADLIALPETMMGQKKPEPLDGPTVTAMANLARKHRTYLVCPIDRSAGERRFNSAVLLDRAGKIVGVYDKVYPYWSEYNLEPPVDAGQDAPVFETDFGRIGIAICFDANFPEVWKRLADQGAELVIFSSAYSAGTTLQAHALMNHYYIVSSTLRSDCVVYDITGEELLFERRSGEINVSRVTLDLDRCIFHKDFNVPKMEKLLKEHADDVVLEKTWDREAWLVLKAKRPGVSARDLARQYGMEELRDYIARSRRQIDEKRGRRFADKVK